MSNKFINAVQQNKDHPTSFYVPDEQDIKKLSGGEFVKVGIATELPAGQPEFERFWCQIESIKGEGYQCEIIAAITNDLLFLDLDFDQLITFKGCNVMDILPDNN